MVAPMDDVRIVEISSWMAAPSAGAMLADLGADVIKVEPLGGDPCATSPASRSWPRARPGIDPSFHVDNRGKRSIAVAIDRQEGAELVRRLVDGADVFLSNLLPHRQERYGLDPDGLFAANPRIVHATLTGYGRDRARRRWRPGYDVTAVLRTRAR